MNFEKENNRRIREFWQQIQTNPHLGNAISQYKFPKNIQTPVSSAFEGSLIGDVYDLHSQNAKYQQEKIMGQAVNLKSKKYQYGSQSVSPLKENNKGQERFIKLGRFSSGSKKKNKQVVRILNIGEVQKLQLKKSKQAREQNQRLQRIKQFCFECLIPKIQEHHVEPHENLEITDITKRNTQQQGKQLVQKRKIKQIICCRWKNNTYIFQKQKQSFKQNNLIRKNVGKIFPRPQP